MASCSSCPDSAQVAEHWPLVVAAFQLAGQLRKRQHRHIQLPGQHSERDAYLRDLLIAALARRLEQLRIVDNQEPQPAVHRPVRLLRPGNERSNVGVVAAQECDRQLREDALGAFDKRPHSRLTHVAAAHCVVIDGVPGARCRLGKRPERHCLRVHFQRGYADAMPGPRRVERDAERKRGLAH